MRIYFAHPVNVYNTPLEEAVLALLDRYFFGVEIVNPNTLEQQKAYEQAKATTGGTHADHKGMETFYRTVESCDGCVSMPFLDGRMGLGVAGETLKTLKARKPAWFIVPDRELTGEEIDAFVADPENGSFRIRSFTQAEVDLLLNHAGDLKDNPPPIVVPHEETRLRTFLQYNGAMRPYAEAHKVKMPPPPDFYALDPKKK